MSGDGEEWSARAMHIIIFIILAGVEHVEYTMVG